MAEGRLSPDRFGKLEGDQAADQRSQPREKPHANETVGVDYVGSIDSRPKNDLKLFAIDLEFMEVSFAPRFFA